MVTVAQPTEVNVHHRGFFKGIYIFVKHCIKVTHKIQSAHVM